MAAAENLRLNAQGRTNRTKPAGRLRLLAALALAVATAPAHGESFDGRVVSVTDGDTVRVRSPGRGETKIRLAGIDCPEGDQPWGDRAKSAAEELLAGKDVRIEVMDTDRYGRIVGRILVGEVNVNRALVADGHCWVYPRYAKDRMLFDLHDEAQKAGRGLWSLPAEKRAPPWEWRRSRN